MTSSLRGRDVEVVFDAGRLTLTSGRSSYGTQVLHIEEYPTLPSVAPQVGRVHADVLLAAVEVAAPFVEADNAFENIRGLRVEADADELAFVGTNRLSLGVGRGTWQGTVPFEAVVPAARLHAAAKGLDGPVEVGCSDGVLSLTDMSRTVTTRLMSPEFIRWAPLVRDMQADDSATFADRDNLIQVVKRAGLLDNGTTGIVLTFGPEEIGVQVEAAERGAGLDFVACEGDSDGTIRFGIRLLMLGLLAMPPGLVRIGLGPLDGGAKAAQVATLRPVDGDNRVALVMPMKAGQ